MDWRDISPACAAVEGAEKPAADAGGPCATCAFRPGTEANGTDYTVTLAALCVEGFREFGCHEHPRLCRGYIAALNLRGVPSGEEDRRWSECAGWLADQLSNAIISAVEAENIAASMR